jgi:hypothetical protein
MAEPTAAEYMKLARAHLARAQAAASADPVDWADLSTYGLYCLEAAVMAAARHLGMGVVKSHAAKAEAAIQLARKHKLPDISDLLPDLNTSRKAHAYGDIEAPDLDAEGISAELEEFADAVAELLKKRARNR